MPVLTMHTTSKAPAAPDYSTGEEEGVSREVPGTGYGRDTGDIKGRAGEGRWGGRVASQAGGSAGLKVN